ncbi:MAG: hypothetical protein ACO1OF_16570 [Adhaeribacter sp.]
MKTTWDWLVRNFSNIFSLIGIVLTIYFALFYVPDYIKENENEKLKTINRELIEAIQEIIYNKQHLSQGQAETLIEGKEIKYKIDYPYSVKELLIQTEEAFMSNKFIPLLDRMNYINKIDSIKHTLKVVKAEQVEKKALKSKFDVDSIFIVVSSLLGLLTSLIGAYSLLNKLKKEKKEEINNAIEKEERQIENRIKVVLNFEELIKSILSKNSIEYQTTPSDLGADFIIPNNRKALFVQVKYLRGNIGFARLGFDRFISTLKKNKGDGIIIINRMTPMTKRTINEIQEELQNNKLYIVAGETTDMIEKQLIEVLKNYR